MNSQPVTDLLTAFKNGHYRQIVESLYDPNSISSGNPLNDQIVAASLFNLGRYHDALSILEPLIGALGQNVDFLSLLGATLRRLGQFERASEIFSAALKINPNSLELNNNYSNLLIDLNRFDEAESILLSLLKSHPDYMDARYNINRLHAKRNLIAESSSHKESSVTVPWGPLDPLMLAFSEETVISPAKNNFSKQPISSSSSKTLISVLPCPDDAKVAMEKLDLAQKTIVSGDPDFVLTLCSSAYLSVGPIQPVFTNASDAYIRKQRFLEAEICLLTGIVLGNPTVNHYINLVSLATLRGDFSLASYYLDLASSLDPDSPSLVQARQLFLQKLEIAKSSNHKFSFSSEWKHPALTLRKP